MKFDNRGELGNYFSYLVIPFDVIYNSHTFLVCWFNVIYTNFLSPAIKLNILLLSLLHEELIIVKFSVTTIRKEIKLFWAPSSVL